MQTVPQVYVSSDCRGSRRETGPSTLRLSMGENTGIFLSLIFFASFVVKGTYEKFCGRKQATPNTVMLMGAGSLPAGHHQQHQG